MHLLAVTSGTLAEGTDAVDLNQSPGDVVILSAADTELNSLATAQQRVALFRLRLANVLRLVHPLSVDVYGERVIIAARLVVVRLLGGRGYWPYGVEHIAALCRKHAILVAFLPGDDRPDADLAGFSTLPPTVTGRLWRYLVYGGAANAEQFLHYAATLIGHDGAWREPAPLPSAGLYPQPDSSPEDAFAPPRAAPGAVIVFYRALVQAGDTVAIDSLREALAAAGLTPMALFVTSFKDPLATAWVREILARFPPDVILNATGFAQASGSALSPSDPLTLADCPVVQVILASSSEETWRASSTGLPARDIAMNVALPEIDGRLLSRAIAFKSVAERDPLTECDRVVARPVPDRVRFAARLAAGWVHLRRTPRAERRIVIVLANYPNRDGRIGNGVGLDTPAATVNVLQALAAAGYGLEDLPADGAALLDRLLAGPTNAGPSIPAAETLSLERYTDFLSRQPESVRRQVWKRWGAPERDPFMGCDRCFALPVVRFGQVAVAIQPARGYNIDPSSSYHDPALIPPHGYLAFYAWARETFEAHAIVHMGKHGTLEWLPGKALALSESCWPEVALGPVPHLYPFIVNDPGEGAQAKRRASAVIIDHLTPPLTRAESYGPLREMERLVDEYYEAAGVDSRRCVLLKDEILSLAHVLGLDRDAGLSAGEDTDAALLKLDNHLCALKELQIRNGLHIFGESPRGELRRDLLVALARVPRGTAPHEVSLLRALADDLGLGFDPLNAVYAEPWTGPRPALLDGESPWRTAGDTVERLEEMAQRVVETGPDALDPAWVRTGPVVRWLAGTLAPMVDACGSAEMAGLLRGLDGRFVPPGPSGAPTRGRPDVLPTGRNFYSVDTRIVPTPAAWTLGWKSATLLLERHVQDHGAWPRAMALTAWGTATMRTGGDDIAQGLALMGARPAWEAASRRVTGFEIMPLAVLDRPRVDVTLRVSGFFRDAFPSLIALFDAAARAVAELEEPEDLNPLAARVREETRRFTMEGLAPDAARRQASYRVFSAPPGAYGAGLQSLINEKGWETEADLAGAYIAWGGYAYGAQAEGAPALDVFKDRLRRVDTVVQNQDNREHDLLDSDDYYQFEGGLTAAVRVVSGRQPVVYHTDHSRPETPGIHTLNEEIARIVRGRAANPKWIAGVMRHGYKGAFEMAATVEYLFAFAASARCVEDHHFDLLFNAYLNDETVRAFMATANPHALREMAERFEEAIARDLWRPRRNDVQATLGEVLAQRR